MIENTKRIYSFNEILEGWIEYKDGRYCYYKKGKSNNLPTVYYNNYGESFVPHFKKQPSLESLKSHGINYMEAYPYYMDLYRDEREPIWISDYRLILSFDIASALRDAYTHYMYWDSHYEEWIEKCAQVFKETNGAFELIEGEKHTGLAPSDLMIEKAHSIKLPSPLLVWPSSTENNRGRAKIWELLENDDEMNR